MKKLIFLIFTLGFFNYSPIVNAQGYAVKPISDFLPEYNEKHRNIIEDIEKRTDLAHAQKFVLYQDDLSKLKEEFKAIRKAEYESKSIRLSVPYNCTGENSGGVKDCGSKCINAPTSDLYTQNDWIKVEGDNKGASVTSSDSTACLRMTVAGKGRKTGTLYATFKYKQESILAFTDKDTNDLFVKIVKQ